MNIFVFLLFFLFFVFFYGGLFLFLAVLNLQISASPNLRIAARESPQDDFPQVKANFGLSEIPRKLTKIVWKRLLVIPSGVDPL